MRGSSLGMNGSFTASEPAAMMARAKPIVVVPPAASSTLTWLASMNRPVPVTTVTLRILAICARPPVSLPTTLFLCATQLGAIDRRRAEARRRPSSKCATSSITAATCSSAFDGMQPTLRQTPPSVAIALDQHDLQAEVGGAERGRVAARAGAEHEQVADRGRRRRRRRVRPRPRRRRGGRRGGRRSRRRRGCGRLAQRPQAPRSAPARPQRPRRPRPGSGSPSPR